MENKKSLYQKKILNLEENLANTNDPTLKNIEEEKIKLNDLKENYGLLEAQIAENNEYINDLNIEKDELIKKCLMKLHADMKKNHQKVNEDHDKYVELYTKAREERHAIERKMMNLKSLVYKNYKVRLI